MKFRPLLIYFLLIVILFFAFTSFENAQQRGYISYSEAVAYFREEQVTKFTVSDRDVLSLTLQDGTVVNDGTRHFTLDELLRMDWLCENIDGFIPEYEEVLPYAQPMMKALGLHKEQIPAEKDDIV